MESPPTLLLDKYLQNKWGTSIFFPQAANYILEMGVNKYRLQTSFFYLKSKSVVWENTKSKQIGLGCVPLVMGKIEVLCWINRK